jgi:2-deoxy-D-gluconate 3-dehydrogenase
MATFKPALDLTMQDWDDDQRRNLRYVFLAAQTFARHARVRSRPGVITCISSMSGVRSAAGHAAYGAAKDALLNMVRTLAVEWAPYAIRINAVTPGSIATPNFPDSEQTREIMRNSLVPMGRSGTIDELCRPILFLCSDMASYVTGHNLWVDGGWGAANLFRFRPRRLRPASRATRSRQAAAVAERSAKTAGGRWPSASGRGPSGARARQTSFRA